MRNVCDRCNTTGSMRRCKACGNMWCSRCYTTNNYPDLPNATVSHCPYCGGPSYNIESVR